MAEKQMDELYIAVRSRWRNKKGLLASGQLSPRANYRHALVSGVIFHEI